MVPRQLRNPGESFVKNEKVAQNVRPANRVGKGGRNWRRIVTVEKRKNFNRRPIRRVDYVYYNERGLKLPKYGNHRSNSVNRRLLVGI